MTTIKERVLQIAEYKEIKKELFFKELGISYANFKGIQKKSALSSDTIDKILTKYSDINPIWLLQEKGDMFLELNNNMSSSIQGIPLIPADAIAGLSSGCISIKENDIQQYYNVPDFTNVDFMIRVKGSSMYPKYNSGDVVACRLISDSKFLQWNKVHIVATKEQGVLIKRLKQSNDENCLLAVSDNKSYDPFNIPKEEILNIALVIGVIRVE